MMNKKTFGLGDLAYYLFRPAVWLVDAVWGTDLHSCERCAERRARWNWLFSVPQWLALFLLTVGVFTVLYIYKL